MIAGDTADAYAFARAKTETLNPSDGGFVVPGEKTELGYTNIGTSYRYWKVAGDNAGATRHVVLTAWGLERMALPRQREPSSFRLLVIQRISDMQSNQLRCQTK